MRLLLFIAFTALISYSGNSQIYYTLGMKTQRVKFLTVYESEETGYVYNPSTGNYDVASPVDTSLSNFYSIGPTLCYGLQYDITNRISVAGELEGHLGLVTINTEGFYFDFGIGARCSYVLDPATYSNVFLRLGAGYGMKRGYSENDVIGVNWRLGYEYDFDSFLMGVALDGNVFLEDLSYYGSVNSDNIILRKLNSIGVAFYISIGKNY